MRSVTVSLLGLALALPARPARSQSLSHRQAQAAAIQVSPDLAAARDAVSAARGRERQAGAFPNPQLAWSREQTGSGTQRNAQDIVALQQALDFTGQRSARQDAARRRREATEVALAIAEARVHFEVTRAYALAVAAERRAGLAAEAAAAFDAAIAVSRERLAAGDVSGYAHRRLQLEAARYATLSAEAMLERRRARLSLAALVAPDAGVVAGATWALTDTLADAAAAGNADSLTRAALANRPELRAAALETQAFEADVRLAARERLPVPVVTAGIKTEHALGAPGSLTGIVAGISLPLPFFDRRGGVVAAAQADARRRHAESEALRRRIAREAADAHAALEVVQQQLALIAPHLGAVAAAALRAAQLAYAEGEIPLIEWLDAVRAYQEAQASYAGLRAEAVIRRAALDRAVGAPLHVAGGN